MKRATTATPGTEDGLAMDIPQVRPEDIIEALHGDPLFNPNADEARRETLRAMIDQVRAAHQRVEGQRVPAAHHNREQHRWPQNPRVFMLNLSLFLLLTWTLYLSRQRLYAYILVRPEIKDAGGETWLMDSSYRYLYRGDLADSSTASGLVEFTFFDVLLRIEECLFKELPPFLMREWLRDYTTGAVKGIALLIGMTYTLFTAMYTWFAILFVVICLVLLTFGKWRRVARFVLVDILFIGCPVDM